MFVLIMKIVSLIIVLYSGVWILQKWIIMHAIITATKASLTDEDVNGQIGTIEGLTIMIYAFIISFVVYTFL